MMKIKSFFLLLVMVFSFMFENGLTKGDAKVCQPNALYGCKRTCRQNCDKLNEIRPPMCIMPCFWGCECKEGYIFKSSASKECVEYAACQVNCPENMHYEPCFKSDPATCDNPDVKPIKGRHCSPWCVCNEGFVFRSFTDRTCVPMSECPKKE
ncbi:IgGFc-binding protein-like [Lissotriton helveticus]